jgi:hypothetical protein
MTNQFAIDFDFSSLSNNEIEAIEWLIGRFGVVKDYEVADKTSRDHLGSLIPGKGLIRKLEKKNIVFFTEEEPFNWGTPEDPNVYTLSPLLCFSEGAREAFDSWRKIESPTKMTRP